ncbi:MAG: LysM peptidoglycan-binding domain-containing protein [Chloroflexota bacterium]
MRNYRFLAFFLVALFVLGLTACEKSASTPPSSSADGTESPLLEGTQSPMDVLVGMTTQTAVAETGGGTGVDATQPSEEVPLPTAEAETDQTVPTPTQEAAAEPEPEIVAPEFEVPNTYTLRAGEFPYCIARRFDVAPGALLNANGLSSASMVYPGTTLTIPKDAGSFNAGPRSLRAHPVKYTIMAGDTVYSIACLFGDVDPRAIEAVNGLTGAYTLSVGQVIQIP